MATIDPVIVKLQADVSDLKAGLERAEASLKGLDDSVKKADSGFSGFTNRIKQLGATIGVTFAASQVVSFFKDSVAAAQEAEAAQARLRQILLTTNGATEAQVDALGEQAKALEAVGVVSANNITVAQSQLATFDLAASSIKKLTPAILNYVTAEKGASASADDFKSMTNGLAQALNGQFGSLTRLGFVLDDATKKTISSGTESERAAALVEVLDSTYAGFNENLRNTSEGAMQVALNDFNNLKQEIGEGLQPIVDRFAKFLTDTLFPAFRKLIKFLKDNGDAIKAFAITIAIGTTAWGLYTIAVNRAKIAQKALNLVQKANPIGIIITAVALLVAWLVKLFNSNQKVRDVIISVAKAGLQGFASIIPIVAKVYEAIAKIVTGPMRLFLTALSKLPGVGKYAKSGLDIINKGLDGISDLGDKAAKKATELSKKLDGMAKIAKKAGEDTKKAVEDPFKGDTRGNKRLAEDEKDKKKKALAALKEEEKRLKTIIKLNEDADEVLKRMREVVADRDKKLAEAAIEREEKIAEAKKRFAEKEADLTKRRDEALAEARKRYDETVFEARKRNAKQLIDIQKRYDEQTTNAAEKLQERIKDIEKSALEKRLKAQESTAEKQASIIEKSIDRLREAFRSGTAVGIAQSFKETQSVDALLDNLKTKLAAIKTLQENAAALAAMGYSQTFIEEVVKEGPEIGNKLAEALRNATPESTKELQALYGQINNVSNYGLDTLAANMNAGGRLATDELMKEFADTQIDLQRTLQDINNEVSELMADAQVEYAKSMQEAAKARDESIADALEQLTEALAEADKTLKEAQDEAYKDFAEGLARANEELIEELARTEKEYAKTVEKIYEVAKEQLDDLSDRLDKIIAKLMQAQATLLALQAQAAAGAITAGAGGGSTNVTGSATGTSTNTTGTNTSNTTGNSNTPTIIINTSDNTTTDEITMAVVAGIRFGQATVVAK